MDVFSIVAVLITLAALFSFVNYRYIHLPTTIGLMLFALLMSLGLIAIGRLEVGVRRVAEDIVSRIDFDQLLLHGMLSFLLFAGALYVNINDLLGRKWSIFSLATAGLITSVFIVGGLTWIALDLLEMTIPVSYCLLFGALISPTDPIAVLGIVKKVGTPKGLEATIAGESLFNDGMAVVVFVVLLQVAAGGHDVTPGEAVWLFAKEAVGGAAVGLALGLLAYRMLKAVDNYQVEILLTLALVMGGYAFADALHTSGPLAIVVAGLLIGNRGRAFAMSTKTREHLDTFWELVDEILNAVLFVLIGLEVLVLAFSGRLLLAGMLMIPVVLLARLVSVSIPIGLLRRRRRLSPHAIKILTWGGLRGGISVALALSLPSGPERNVILPITYMVVVFSIIVQGLTIRRLVERCRLSE